MLLHASSDAPPAQLVSSLHPSSPRRRRRRWPWLAVAAILGMGATVAVVGRSKAPSIDPAAIAIVTKKSLAVEILETGRVQPRERVELKSKVAGQVQSVLVHEGDLVKKGDVLLILDPIDYQRDLAKAEADLARAAAAHDYARVVRARAERGFAQGIASKTELDQAMSDERTQALAVRAADVARSVAQDHLRYTKIVSPMDGIVIARSIEPGEAVIPGVQSTFDGKSLMTVADLSTLLVKVSLNQIDVAKVAVGRKATLTLDALPGHEYTATITKVAPASVKLPGKEQEIFPVEATLDSADRLVKPGMTADVRIHLDAKEGVLAVPLEAVVKESGRSYVTRVTEKKKGVSTAEKVEVAVGLRNDREGEITSGVKEGDRVLLRPGSAAENETKL